MRDTFPTSFADGAPKKKKNTDLKNGGVVMEGRGTGGLAPPILPPAVENDKFLLHFQADVDAPLSTSPVRCCAQHEKFCYIITMRIRNNKYGQLPTCTARARVRMAPLPEDYLPTNKDLIAHRQGFPESRSVVLPSLTDIRLDFRTRLANGHLWRRVGSIEAT